MAVEVRPARRGDVDEVCQIASDAWHAAHEPIVGADAVESFLEEYYDETSFFDRVDDPETVFAVAVGGNAPVGFAVASPDDEDPGLFHLGMLYVDPDCWRDGVGSQLCSYVESAVEALGGRRIRLGVMAENDRAVGFYEAAGYERVEDFYDDRIDVRSLVYEKGLSGDG